MPGRHGGPVITHAPGGHGAAAQVQFAILSGAPALTAGDFTVI